MIGKSLADVIVVVGVPEVSDLGQEVVALPLL